MSTLTNDLARLANNANVLVTAITTNGSAITSVNVAGVIINSSGVGGAPVSFSNNVTITGNLVVTGSTVTVNTTTLDVKDLNITVAKGAGSAAAANGAGLTVDAGYANLYYDATANSWSTTVGLNVLSGNVGIGNTSPAFKLHVMGNIAANNEMRIYGATNPYLAMSSNNGLGTAYTQISANNYDMYYAGAVTFSPGSSIKAFIGSDGNTGIGTTTPPNRFSIYSTSAGLSSTAQISHGAGDWGLVMKRISNDTGFANFSFLKSRGESNTAIVAGDNIGRITWHAVTNTALNTVTQMAEIGVFNNNYDGANADCSMWFCTKPQNGIVTERMRLDDSGNLGVGTTSPSSYGKFGVVSGVNYFGVAPDQYTSVVFGPRYANDGYCSVLYSHGTNGAGNFWKFDSHSGSFSLTQSVSGVQTTKMFISSNGNIGIGGTSSPEAKLDVGGSITTANAVYTILSRPSGGDGNFCLTTSTGSGTTVSSEMCRLSFKYGTGTTYHNAGIGFYRGGDVQGGFLTFNTSNWTEAMRIDASQNVGIGTSPSYRLDVYGSTVPLRIRSTSDNNQFRFYGTSTGAELIAIGTNVADGGTGANFDIYNLVSSVNIARFCANNNVGIGTLYPTAKLMVSRATGKASGPGVWIEAQDNTGSIKDNVGLLLNDGSSGSSGGCSLIFRQTNSASPRRYAGIWGVTALSGSGGELVFGTINSDNDTTGPTDSMRIDNTGSLVIGNSSRFSSEKLSVYQTSSAKALYLRCDNASMGDALAFLVTARNTTNASYTVLQYYNTGAAATRFYVADSGKLYSTDTAIGSISDIRHKENIRDLDQGLETILLLKPRRFDWKENKGNGKKNVAGFIAQEVEPVMPDLIDGWKDDETSDLKALSMGGMVPSMVKAIQELNDKLEAALKRIEELENK